MQFLFYSLFSFAIVAVDQITKYLTVANIAYKGNVPFLPGILSLTYVKNDGAMWSLLKGQQWLFAVVFALLTVGILYEYFKARLPFSTFDRWCIAAIFGGGLGNMIDRLRFGYVVDMIETEFITFPVFNVADCFITCGCIALLISLIFFNKGFWKEEKNEPHR